MPKFSIDKVQELMKSTPMIPVFNHVDVDTAKSVVDASYNGGVRVFEFTNRGANAYEVFKELVKHVEQYPDMTLGIGTILDVPTTEKFLSAGAHFIVSPIMNPDMAEVCNRHSVMWIPGCATLTEIVNAKNAGARIIKVFPGSTLGPKFISSVLPVIPDLQLMPTGGVEPTVENLSAWFKAGVVCVGMGSQLFSKEMIQNKEWKQLEEKIKATLDIISGLKQ